MRYADEHPDVARHVLDGTSVRCRGCGRDQGVTCVAFPADWEPAEFVFPFPLDDCPVCWLEDVAMNGYPSDRQPERPPGWRPTEHARGRLP